MKMKVFTLFALVAVLLLTSCQSEDLGLPGTWNCTSVKIDGQESIGVLYASLFMVYSETSTNQGVFAWKTNSASGVDILTGGYKINDAGNVVTYIVDGDPDSDFNMTLDNDNLTISTPNLSGSSINIVAERE